MEKVYKKHGRDYKNLKYCYPVVSRRSGGLSLGINLNPDKLCNFDCPYCQVDRRTVNQLRFSHPEFEKEIEAIIPDVLDGSVFEIERLKSTPPSRRVWKDIAFAGDGEPSTSPHLLPSMKTLYKLSTTHNLPKVTWISNATGLSKPKTIESMEILAELQGEIWAKVDAGSQKYFETISGVTRFNLDRICGEIAGIESGIGLKIQTCLMKVHGSPPSPSEITLLKERLLKIAEQREISEVQIYTIARDPSQDFVSAIKLSQLQEICEPLVQASLPIQFYSGNAD